MNGAPRPGFASPSGPHLLGFVLGGVILVSWVGVLVTHVGAVAGGSDSSGYLNEARLLAHGQVHVQPRRLDAPAGASVSPLLYVPLGFEPAPNGDGMVPTYPPGLPLWVLLLSFLVGWPHAPAVVIILHSVAGVAATVLLARRLGLSRGWAALGAVMLAVSPIYLFMSLQAMSDVPSLVWTTAAMLAALESPRRPSWALVAGASLAIDVLLRPANVIALVPLAVLLGPSLVRWRWFILGGLPGAIFFFAYNTSTYGHPLTTGYGDESFFSTHVVPETLLHYLHWIPAVLTPLSLLALGVPWLEGEARPHRALLISWMGTFTVFYAAYRWTHEAWWYLRFLLPAVPAALVGSLLVAQGLVSRYASAKRAILRWLGVGAVGTMVAISSFYWDDRLHPLSVGREEQKYVRLIGWLKEHLESNAACLAMQVSGSLMYYTDFPFVRYDKIQAGDVPVIEAALQTAAKPLYAVLFPFELTETHALDRAMPGHWVQAGSVEDVTIWKRDFGDDRAPASVSPEPAVYIEGARELTTNSASGQSLRVRFTGTQWWEPESERRPGQLTVDAWRWSRGNASLSIHNPQPFALLAEIHFGLATLDPRAVTVAVRDRIVWGDVILPAQENQAVVSALALPPGDTILDVQSDAPARSPGTDPRLLAFSIRNLVVRLGRPPGPRGPAQ